MALRNQPYIPLYVQDYLTDEKLNLCSWQTQGIYIKILCILHKQKNYGSILFKQYDKQNENKIFYFASILIKSIPCQLNDMTEALTDLIDNEVIYIDDEGMHQKRMVKDGRISDERSKAAKKGGGNPNLFKQNIKQTSKQNTEYENENENKKLNSEISDKLLEKVKEIALEVYNLDLDNYKNINTLKAAGAFCDFAATLPDYPIEKVYMILDAFVEYCKIKPSFKPSSLLKCLGEHVPESGRWMTENWVDKLEMARINEPNRR